VIELIFQFFNSSLCFLKQCSKRANMGVVASSRKCHEIFQSVVIPNPVYVMNLPAFGRRAMSFFPNKNMFPNLPSDIRSWVVRSINPNVTCRTFTSPTLPCWTMLPPLRFIITRTAQRRMTPYIFSAFGAWFFVPFLILIIQSTPFSPLFVAVPIIFCMTLSAVNPPTWLSAIFAKACVPLSINSSSSHMESIALSIRNSNKEKPNSGRR